MKHCHVPGMRGLSVGLRMQLSWWLTADGVGLARARGRRAGELGRLVKPSELVLVLGAGTP
jgi:hypothetical protein